MSPTTDRGVGVSPEASAWLEARLGRELELPMLPEAAARVVALCTGEQADAKKLEAVIERDPSLTTYVLKVANSTLYASKERIVSLQHAISRLGMSTVRNLAYTHSMHGRMFVLPGHGTRVQTVWDHCAVSAVFARELGRHLRRNVEAAFLCGLIHDVGRPLVLQTALSMPRSIGVLNTAQLESAIDEHHGRVGARLVAAWGLPAWAAAAVEHHHDPERAKPHEEVARITALADLLADWALDRARGADDFDACDPSVAALNLYPEELDLLLDLRERVLRDAEVLR